MVEKKASKGPSGLVKTYLFAYNFIETLGWSYLLLQLSTFYLSPKQGQTSLYETVKWTVNIFQNAAVLEILHAAIGFVSSSPMVTLKQVFSRVFLVCCVLLPSLEARASPGLPLALLAWCVTEIIRYGYYTLNIVNSVPQILVWLRYTTFIVLYPIGVTGELLCLYAAQSDFNRNRRWSLPLTESFTFHYYYLLIFIMLLYIPIFPQMYLHMFVLRKKVLGPKKKE